MGLHQTKKFLHSKENHQQNKRQPTEWESVFADTSDKGLIFKTYKIQHQKNQATQLKNGQRT